MRNKRLDILRCIAILLVMLYHGDSSLAIADKGWIGVDLFFVLSGFLISGLLFSEYKAHGSIRFKRFFIRRGLKIYPAFYLYIFVTLVVSHFVLHWVGPARHYVAEILFVQNYWEGVWAHTWTLAVEEHFYVLLPILLVFLARRHPERRDPFGVLPWIFLAVAVLCMSFRAVSACIGTPNYHTTYAATHARIDSLFFGVLLGYFYHFRPHVLERLMGSTGNRLLVAVCSAGLLSPLFFYSRFTKFFAVFGYTCNYLAFGGILLVALYHKGILRGWIERAARAVGTGLAMVGMYSYSIYLWQGPGGAWLPGLLKRMFHVSFRGNARFAVYVVGSLVIGITMSKIVEYPVLRLRDRIFPPREGVVVRPSETIEEDRRSTTGVANPAV
ncbi:MAG TPA: acyltransferase [Candidatus Acidoferrales bacterium]|jgi:peptidoglycan/LPS O-acetylase OafA/YrhL|nr:acyltransferase [Candidatus Acidoferrales bacterium]